jgi:lipid-binding SYLF domain-containing protein
MRTAITSSVVFALFMTVGCATAPRTQAQRDSLVAESDATVATMTSQDPSLRDLLDRSPGYAVYPNVGSAGAIVGGAYGRGVVFEDGQPVGYTELNQGSVGAIIGGQSFSQIIVFENDAAIGRMKAGNFDLGAEASAVALKAGIAANARFEDGVAVFQMPKGGLMATAAINGQKINYEPMGGASRDGLEANAEADAEAMTAGDDSASLREVDRNLESSQEVEIRTEETGSSAGDSAQRATDRTQQRIQQRLEETQKNAQDAADEME